MFGRVEMGAAILAAIAIPTAFPTPWLGGPWYTPHRVSPNSMSGVLLCNWRKFLISSSENQSRRDGANCKETCFRDRGQNETIAIDPLGVRWIDLKFLSNRRINFGWREEA